MPGTAMWTPSRHCMQRTKRVRSLQGSMWMPGQPLGLCQRGLMFSWQDVLIPVLLASYDAALCCPGKMRDAPNQFQSLRRNTILLRICRERVSCASGHSNQGGPSMKGRMPYPLHIPRICRAQILLVLGTSSSTLQLSTVNQFKQPWQL